MNTRTVAHETGSTAHVLRGAGAPRRQSGSDPNDHSAILTEGARRGPPRPGTPDSFVPHHGPKDGTFGPTTRAGALPIVGWRNGDDLGEQHVMAQARTVAGGS